MVTAASGPAAAGLDEAFRALGRVPVHRASAVFPVLLRPGSDVIIATLNYWKLKNGIGSVLATLRIYDAQGVLDHVHEEHLTGDHYEWSMAQLIGARNFQGMVEIEILSMEDLIFSFPGLSAFYRAGDAFSVVHSAGRVRNPEEGGAKLRSVETNWSCRFDSGWTPVFHIFNGPHPDGEGHGRVRLHRMDGTDIAAAEIDIPDAQPFASRLIEVDTLFDPATTKDAAFVSVTRSASDVFPRMVVGNLRRADGFLAATHSFQWIEREEYVVASADRGAVDVPSFMALLQPPGLSAELVSFPTNWPSQVMASLSVQRADEPRLGRAAPEFGWTTGGADAETLRVRVDDDVRMAALSFRGDRLPARINASVQYRVAGEGAMDYCTDIASGALACVYPPKRSHWGHGLIGGGFDTHVMFHNIAHRPSERVGGRIALAVFDRAGRCAETGFDIAPEAGRIVRLGEVIGDRRAREPHIVSWFATADTPAMGSFWVASASDGRVCGDHGF